MMVDDHILGENRGKAPLGGALAPVEVLGNVDAAERAHRLGHLAPDGKVRGRREFVPTDIDLLAEPVKELESLGHVRPIRIVDTDPDLPAEIFPPMILVPGSRSKRARIAATQSRSAMQSESVEARIGALRVRCRGCAPVRGRGSVPPRA
jgi:hypothetical protein